ncbi:MAG: dethiobiotin synthase [Candidatus Margulisiibacteriota bacterium]
MKAVFICGTDTAVGKTYFTGKIYNELLDKGINAVTQKWVQTGSKGFSPDIAQHLKMAGKTKRAVKDIIDLVNPYSFKHASSPHLAARLEKKKIDVQKIKTSFKKLSKMFDHVIVEGVGGALVPLNKKTLVIDVVKELGLPAVIVAANRLGTVNQTLMTVEALKKRKIKILGIVFNNMQEDQDPKILKDNPLIISELAGVPVLGTLPYKG